MKGRGRVYLDFAAATPLSARAERAYVRALKLYGNPSAPHAEGRAARTAIELARIQIARSLTVRAEELIFTSGGTESNNLAILGTPKGHCITSALEHSSVRQAFKIREEHGSRVSVIKSDAFGSIAPEDVVRALRPHTVLVSLHHVQGECGVVQRIGDIARAVKKVNPKIIVHVDAAQSPLWVEAGPHALHADLVSYDAQKVGGPKGVGVLYRNFDVPLRSVYGGGTQERSLRPGTENTPALVAAGVAFVDAATGRKVRTQKVSALRDDFVSAVLERIPGARLLGSTKRRVANNAFFVIPDCDGDYLAVLLDTHGIAVTPRSACLGSGGALSETAFELTRDESLARATLRVTLGPSVTKSDLTRALKVLESVYRLAQRQHA